MTDVSVASYSSTIRQTATTMSFLSASRLLTPHTSSTDPAVVSGRVSGLSLLQRTTLQSYSYRPALMVQVRLIMELSRFQTDLPFEVNATVHTSNNGTANVEIKILNADGSELAGCSGSSNTALTFQAEGAKLWTPDSPTLYNVSVTLGDDVINSYTAFRTVSRGEVNGIQRPLLNGEFVFQFGTLDQGYWPDGLYTPPNREAMEYDLTMLKDLGFNMLRKHVSLHQ